MRRLAAERLPQVAHGRRTLLPDERPHLRRRLRHRRGAHDELGVDLDDLAGFDQESQRPLRCGVGRQLLARRRFHRLGGEYLPERLARGSKRLGQLRAVRDASE